MAISTVGTNSLAASGVTQAKLGTNVAGNGPAFSAYKSANQTISQNTATKVTFDTESYDTNNNFASSTFTPTVAGYYQPTGSLFFTGSGGRQYVLVVIVYKNGSAFSRSTISAAMGTGGEWSIPMPSVLVSMNGTTDYLEVYAYSYDYTASASVVLNSGSQYTTFGAYLVRAA